MSTDKKDANAEGNFSMPVFESLDLVLAEIKENLEKTENKENKKERFSYWMMQAFHNTMQTADGEREKHMETVSDHVYSGIVQMVGDSIAKRLKAKIASEMSAKANEKVNNESK
jgi:hypothetical protein